jgi:two-component system, NarL family, sensor histidine kinase EvgS
MNDCLFKPLDLATLSDKLMALRPHACKINDREPDSEFDFRALKKLTGGDSSLIEDLLGEMIESNDSDLQALAQALDQNELGIVANVTRNLRETAFLIKAERVLASSQTVIHALKAIFKASTSTWRNHAVQ